MFGKCFFLKGHGMGNEFLSSSKDWCHKLQVCAINYFYLILYACVQRFDITKNLEMFWELNKASDSALDRGNVCAVFHPLIELGF